MITKQFPFTAFHEKRFVYIISRNNIAVQREDGIRRSLSNGNSNFTFHSLHPKLTSCQYMGIGTLPVYIMPTLLYRPHPSVVYAMFIFQAIFNSREFWTTLLVHRKYTEIFATLQSLCPDSSGVSDFFRRGGSFFFLPFDPRYTHTLRSRAFWPQNKDFPT